ncbi:MAG: MarR family winged helix-turn-helix transcriptional regulator [Porcipelethomonas sp.]
MSRQNKRDIRSGQQDYSMMDPNDRLIINFRDLSHTIRSLYEGKGSQKQVLIVLGRTGAITQSELTDRLGIQPGSASEVIAKLERAGLILRRPSETDRRTSDIELTDSGKELSEQFTQQRIRRHEEMFSCLEDNEKLQLLALLEKINADWEKRYCGAGKEEKYR